jgi:hypothetical protein
MNALATLHDVLAPVPWIKKFRVVQETDSPITVDCVTDGNHRLDELRALLHERVPSLAGRVEPRIVPELPSTGTGSGVASKEAI